MVSVLLPKILYWVIVLQQNNSECLRYGNREPPSSFFFVICDSRAIFQLFQKWTLKASPYCFQMVKEPKIMSWFIVQKLPMLQLTSNKQTPKKLNRSSCKKSHSSVWAPTLMIFLQFVWTNFVSWFETSSRIKLFLNHDCYLSFNFFAMINKGWCVRQPSFPSSSSWCFIQEDYVLRTNNFCLYKQRRNDVE